MTLYTRFKKSVIVLLFFCSFLSLHAQNDSYYSSINPSLSTFISDLKARIRNPYTRILYGDFRGTNVEKFASYLIHDSLRGVICVYSGWEYTYYSPFAWGTMSREHTWCQSWMPVGGSNTDQYQDQHHLFPTEQNHANGVRSNHLLGKVTTVTSSFFDCKYGKNSSGQNVFEPRNSHKGDAARALLYMCIRYDDIGGYTWNFNWLNSFLPTKSEAPEDLNLLLQWCKDDPPDKWEVDRNNYIESIQKNRNPFVDHPEYVNYINFNDLTLLNPVYAVEPANYITNLSTSATENSITLNWTDAASGSQVPSGYLLEAFSKNNYFIPIDGSTYTDKIVLDSAAVLNISYGTNSYTFSGLSSNKTYYFRIYSFNGDGSLRNYKTTGTVPSISASTGSTALSPEPSNYITNLSASNITTNSITLGWTGALAGTQSPSGYLILANNTNSFTPPIDGTPCSNDSNLADGSAAINIAYGSSDQYTFTGLYSSTNYYFRVYSFNGTGTAINYKTDGTVPAISAATLNNSSGGFVPVDNFNRNDSNVIGQPSSFSSLIWNKTETISGTSIGISSGRLKMLSTSGGMDFAYIDLSGLYGYPATPKNAGTIMQWAFNMRSSRANPSGFDNANYGIAFILAAGSSDFKTANGYAVIIGNSNTPDPLRLVYFTGGLNANSKISNIISDNSDTPTNFYSVRVTYSPSSGEWALYAESSTSDFPESNPASTSVKIGNNSVNNTFTSSSLPYMGALWNHNTSSSDYAIFDDIYITDPNGVQPVHLNYFNANTSGRNVVLRWSTSFEINNSGFDVERMNNSSGWEKIGFVKGAGTINNNANYKFEDNNLKSGKYKYRLRQIDLNGSSVYHKLNGDVTVSTPSGYNLHQNYPNPFNPATKIDFDLPADGYVTFTVYDITGKEISRLINNEFRKADYYSVQFNADKTASGIYFCCMAVNNFVQTKKMVLLK